MSRLFTPCCHSNLIGCLIQIHTEALLHFASTQQTLSKSQGPCHAHQQFRLHPPRKKQLKIKDMLIINLLGRVIFHVFYKKQTANWLSFPWDPYMVYSPTFEYICLIFIVNVSIIYGIYTIHRYTMGFKKLPHHKQSSFHSGSEMKFFHGI